jgi:hypothetical protein
LKGDGYQHTGVGQTGLHVAARVQSVGENLARLAFQIISHGDAQKVALELRFGGEIRAARWQGLSHATIFF